MKPDDCQAVQNRVLALPDPRRVPDPLRAHLDGCASCRRWYSGVARLERLLAALPAPASDDRKAAVIDELTAAGPVIKSVPSLAGRSWSGWPGAAKFAGAWKPLLGIAAAVAVAAGAWVALKPGPKVPEVVEHRPHPLLQKVVERDTNLARAATPIDRLKELGKLADDLNEEVRSLARVADPKELNELAGWYEKVVGDGLVKQANKLPPLALTPAARREEFERLADQLEKSRGEAEQLARGEVPPGAKTALDRVSKAARDGQSRLRALAHGGV